MPDVEATANSCAPAVASGAANAQGVDSVAISSPTIFVAPKQPPRDDGRMLALASLIGGFMDAILGGDGISEALAAEGTWKNILDNILYPRGQQELNRVDAERAKLPEFEADLRAMWLDYRAKADLLWPQLRPLNDQIGNEITESEQRSDSEWSHLSPLDNTLHDAIASLMALSQTELDQANALCTDEALEKLCEFVACGYSPDYHGIRERAAADAALAEKTLVEDACRLSKRYHTRRSQHDARDIRLATMSAAIANSVRMREAERVKAFEINADMRFKHASLMEQTRMGRLKYSHDLRTSGEGLAERRWNAHADVSFRHDQRVMEALRERWTSIAKLYLDVEGRADQLGEAQWRMFAESAFRSLREGGEMLAAAAQAYQFLAASVRATARQGGGGAGGITSALTSLAVLLPMFSGSCSGTTVLGTTFNPRPQECCGTGQTQGA